MSFIVTHLYFSDPARNITTCMKGEVEKPPGNWTKRLQTKHLQTKGLSTKSLGAMECWALLTFSLGLRSSSQARLEAEAVVQRVSPPTTSTTTKFQKYLTDIRFKKTCGT